MKYGYLRVSTKEQNEARQVSEIIKYVELQNIYVDKVSGKNFEREKYQLLKEKARKGDEIYFKELDRLGRNKKQIKEELEYFRKNDVILHFLDIPTTIMNFDNFGEMQKNIMDMVNTILIEVLTTQAEAEYRKIRQRQIEGIQIAKKGGKYKNCGRKPFEINGNFIVLYENYKHKKITGVDFAKMLGISKSTLYKYLKNYEKSP